MLRWIFRRLSWRLLKRIADESESEVFHRCRKEDREIYGDITLDQLEEERRKIIEEDDDIFEHPEVCLHRPVDAPDPHCFGFSNETPSVPVGPPEAPPVDHLFAAREAEEANRKCAADHLAYQEQRAAEKERQRIKDSLPAPTCPICGEDMITVEEYWVCEDCNSKE